MARKLENELDSKLVQLTRADANATAGKADMYIGDIDAVGTADDKEEYI